MSNEYQYLKLCPKQIHYFQWCSHLFGCHYAWNYASQICQDLNSVDAAREYPSNKSLTGTTRKPPLPSFPFILHTVASNFERALEQSKSTYVRHHPVVESYQSDVSQGRTLQCQGPVHCRRSLWRCTGSQQGRWWHQVSSGRGQSGSHMAHPVGWFPLLWWPLWPPGWGPDLWCVRSSSRLWSHHQKRLGDPGTQERGL